MKWIQGKTIVKDWGVLPEELLQAFETESLLPWHRLEDRPMTDYDLLRLVCDDIDARTGPHNYEQYISAIQKAYYNEDDAREFFEFTERTDFFIYPECASRGNAQALTALKMQADGATWKEIAEYMWPNEEYETDSAIRKRLERTLRRGREIIDKAINDGSTS